MQQAVYPTSEDLWLEKQSSAAAVTLILLFHQKKQHLFSALRDVSFIPMSLLGEERGAVEAGHLSCVFLFL